MDGQLTTRETKTLAKCEATIAKGLGTFCDVGRALADIRDGRLYRDAFASFEVYCQERWEIGRHRAYQLITAAEVQADLVTNVTTPPTREAHVRPLLTIPEEHRRDVWEDAIDSAPAGPDGKPRVTARCVEQAVERWKRRRAGDDDVIDVESAPVAVQAPKQLAPPPDDLVRCSCCGEMVEPDADGTCPHCLEPEIVVQVKPTLKPRAYTDDDGKVVAVIRGLWSDRADGEANWISARGRHRVKSPALPPRKTWEEAQADLDAYAAERGWTEYETDQPVAVESPPAVEQGTPLEALPNWIVNVGAIAYVAIEVEGRPAVANRLQQLATEILMG